MNRAPELRKPASAGAVPSPAIHRRAEARTRYRHACEEVRAEHLRQAVTGLRKAAAEHHIPRGLLAQATLHRLQHDLPAARADLTEAEDIATRGHMRLHETDAHLEWTRLHLQEGNRDAACDRLAKARALVDATGYERRRREVEWLTGQVEAI